MKIDKDIDGGIRSEGKVLEIVPMLREPSGDTMMLPPAVYHVPNELLGYRDFHFLGYPLNINVPVDVMIPGSNSAISVRLTFMLRIREDSPDMIPEAETDIGAAAVQAFLAALSRMRDSDQARG